MKTFMAIFVEAHLATPSKSVRKRTADVCGAPAAAARRGHAFWDNSAILGIRTCCGWSFRHSRGPVVPRYALFAAVILLLACQGRAQESDYIVADAVGKNDAFYRAATRLAAHRSAIIVPLDLKNLNAFRDALRQKPPRYVAVVIRPEELDYDLARRFLVMATQLDDDPFVDFSYGFITGVTAEEALAFVERSIKSEEAHREPDLGSISVGESTRSMEVPGTFPWRNKSIGHPQGRLAGPQQL